MVIQEVRMKDALLRDRALSESASEGHPCNTVNISIHGLLFFGYSCESLRVYAITPVTMSGFASAQWPDPSTMFNVLEATITFMP
eukprot:1137454-Pelagomonas_calceolata.AAC.4